MSRIPSIGEKNVLIKVLKQYKNSPCLWNSTNKKYHDKEAKFAAWEKIAKIWQQVKPKATNKDIKMKLFHMRTNYQRQQKRVSYLNIFILCTK